MRSGEIEGLVTGAGSGIGQAVLARMAEAGISPCLAVDLTPSIPASFPAGRVTIHERIGDVAEEDTWHAIERDFGARSLRMAAICAGVSLTAPVQAMTLDNWRKVMRANLDGAFLAVRTALRLMVDGGQIVVISSATARKPAKTTAAYGASKAALEQLVRVAALEAAERGISVNAIAPGGVKTPMFSAQAWFRDMVEDLGSDDAAYDAIATATPLGRFSEPDDIAGLVMDVLAGRFAEMTGTIIPIDGGYGLT